MAKRSRGRALAGLMDPQDAIENAMISDRLGLTGRDHMRDLQGSPHFAEVLAGLMDELQAQGITGIKPLGSGYESAVFAANDGKVVKVGPESHAFQRPYDYVPPTGVEGVLPYTRKHIVVPDNDWNVIVQDMVESGRATGRDAGYLGDLLNRQGYGAIDAHNENIGFLSREPYRPVIFDGVVLPRRMVKGDDGVMIDVATGMRLPGLPPGWTPPKMAPWLMNLAKKSPAVAAAIMGLDSVQASEPVAEGERPDPLSQFISRAPDQRTTAEKLTGGDWSFDISPYEEQQWQANPELGYGGPEHQQYIANAVEMLDEPLIPEGYIRRLGFSSPEQWAANFGGYQGGPMTPRQFLTGARSIELNAAHRNFVENPQDEAAVARFQAAVEAFSVPDATPANVQSNPFTDPYAASAFAALTGQGDKLGMGDVGRAMIDGLRSGTTNRVFEDDPTVTQSEFAELERQYGDDANRILTEGGQENLRRERAADFFAALQNNNPNMNIGSAVMAIGSGPKSMPAEQGTKHRFDVMMDPSSHRGRMEFANARLVAANQTLNPEQGPVLARAEAVDRLDPYSMPGFMGVTGNSSWGYGRAYNQFAPLFGDAGTRSQLKQSFDDQRPLDFLADTYNRTLRETPIRPDWQNQKNFTDARAMSLRRQGDESLDYYSTFAPKMADAWNESGIPRFASLFNQDIRAPRSYFPEIVDSAVKMGPAVMKSPMQLGTIAAGVGGPALLQGGGKASLLGGLSAAAGEAFVDEPMENMMLGETNPMQLLSPVKGNSWLRPYPPEPGKRTVSEYTAMFDPGYRQGWDKAVEETKERDFYDVNDQYGQWLRGNRRRLERQEPSFYRQ